jgi:hypothetical protein
VSTVNLGQYHDDFGSSVASFSTTVDSHGHQKPPSKSNSLDSGDSHSQSHSHGHGQISTLYPPDKEVRKVKSSIFNNLMKKRSKSNISSTAPGGRGRADSAGDADRYRDAPPLPMAISIPPQGQGQPGSGDKDKDYISFLPLGPTSPQHPSFGTISSRGSSKGKEREREFSQSSQFPTTTPPSSSPPYPHSHLTPANSIKGKKSSSFNTYIPSAGGSVTANSSTTIPELANELTVDKPQNFIDASFVLTSDWAVTPEFVDTTLSDQNGKNLNGVQKSSSIKSRHDTDPNQTLAVNGTTTPTPSAPNGQSNSDSHDTQPNNVLPQPYNRQPSPTNDTPTPSRLPSSVDVFASSYPSSSHHGHSHGHGQGLPPIPHSDFHNPFDTSSNGGMSSKGIDTTFHPTHNRGPSQSSLNFKPRGSSIAASQQLMKKGVVLANGQGPGPPPSSLDRRVVSPRSSYNGPQRNPSIVRTLPGGQVETVHSTPPAPPIPNYSGGEGDPSDDDPSWTAPESWDVNAASTLNGELSHAGGLAEIEDDEDGYSTDDSAAGEYGGGRPLQFAAPGSKGAKVINNHPSQNGRLGMGGGGTGRLMGQRSSPSLGILDEDFISVDSSSYAPSDVFSVGSGETEEGADHQSNSSNNTNANARKARRIFDPRRILKPGKPRLAHQGSLDTFSAASQRTYPPGSYIHNNYSTNSIPKTPGSAASSNDDPKKYNIRIYLANNTFHNVKVGFQVTVSALLPRLQNSLVKPQDNLVYKLYLKEKGRGGYITFYLSIRFLVGY